MRGRDRFFVISLVILLQTEREILLRRFCLLAIDLIEKIARRDVGGTQRERAANERVGLLSASVREQIARVKRVTVGRERREAHRFLEMFLGQRGLANSVFGDREIHE